MKVAALQMVSGVSREANLARAQALLQEAADAGAELAVLPEYFCLMGRQEGDKLALREQSGAGPVQDFLAAQARALGLWIVGGTLPLQAHDDAHVFNSTLVYGPTGACVARYDKIHLFRFDSGLGESYDEARVIAPGREPVCFELQARDGQRWRVGLSVCYDLRFPELYRALARQGADLLLVPAAFTHTTGQAHWEVLLRARAIENLAWVCAAAQGGTHENGRRTWGQSLIADPWGQVLAQRATGEGVVLAELDPARLQQCRHQLPALTHCVL
ncbi:carbon-nitrogen hydrolase family protein [Xenophilus arseniciresistens]|uniref:Carbon-nitrogen hydrolase family protein n=1 Tax=Xenophilus arseniciresistens TaxID=1283306 RepID=A0AAE3NC00_9BURK|nr:carbon-nitrogen hydrolase family protein [Xenophilus arseniciresistens]MDA7418408.1 carbon-nitrogen hydrolase family protein [Xenophilus arseniciresistens]